MKMSASRLLWRFCGLVLLVCLGCAAQSNNTDSNRNIERHIRAQYELPANVNVAIRQRTPSPDFPGYDSLPVTISLGDKKVDYNFIISKDSKTLIRTTKMDLTKDPYADNLAKLHIDGRPVRGNKDAKVTIVNFDDFQCPYCALMHAELTQEVQKSYGDKVKLVYKDFPLTEIHPWAKHAAIDANCLATQNASAYWNFADDIHAQAKEMSHGMTLDQQKDKIDLVTIQQGQKAGVNMDTLQACVKAQKDDAVKASMDEADALGVDSTPTMFINGQKISGALPPDELRKVIDRALTDAGETPPPPPAAPVAPKSSGGI
jgi:protein-disulfide isomerase